MSDSTKGDVWCCPIPVTTTTRVAAPDTLNGTGRCDAEPKTDLFPSWRKTQGISSCSLPGSSDPFSREPLASYSGSLSNKEGRARLLIALRYSI